jgi:hypothetical protein
MKPDHTLIRTANATQNQIQGRFASHESTLG